MNFYKSLVSISSILCLFVLMNGCDLGPTQGAFLRVNSDSCVGCRECERVCNADAIIIISEKAVIDPSKCIECGKCIDACPYDAIE